METNSKKLMEALPDWQDFMNLAEEIKRLSLSKMNLEMNIKVKESDTFKELMTNEKFFVGGKPVSVSHYESCFKYTGIDGCILDDRSSLANVSAELELKKTQYEIYKQMLDVWRTVSANERSVV